MRIIDGFGTAGNDTELTLINAQCAESEALLGFRAAPGCLGITQFQVCSAPVVDGRHAFAACSLLDNALAPHLLQERPLQCSWLLRLMRLHIDQCLNTMLQNVQVEHVLSDISGSISMPCNVKSLRNVLIIHYLKHPVHIALGSTSEEAVWLQFICGPNDPQTIRGNDASRPKVPNPSPLAPPPVASPTPPASPTPSGGGGSIPGGNSGAAVPALVGRVLPGYPG